VYSIISDLCPALALSQLKVICACIEKKDISTFDIQLLKCIFDISNALFRVQTNVRVCLIRFFPILFSLILIFVHQSIEISQNFGVSLLWRVIQESNVLLAKYVRNEAVNTFVQLLASEHAVMQRNIYLELCVPCIAFDQFSLFEFCLVNRCISSLQRHENSSQALRLLRSIISIYPQVHSLFALLNEWLDFNYRLISSLRTAGSVDASKTEITQLCSSIPNFT
jgi:hypothetical protein